MEQYDRHLEHYDRQWEQCDRYLEHSHRHSEQFNGHLERSYCHLEQYHRQLEQWQRYWSNIIVIAPNIAAIWSKITVSYALPKQKKPALTGFSLKFIAPLFLEQPDLVLMFLFPGLFASGEGLDVVVRDIRLFSSENFLDG